MRKHIKTMLALGMCLAFIFSGCASVQRPERDLIMDTIAQNAGYLMAKENPELATLVLEYTEAMPDFDSWKAWVIAQLIGDEFLRMNFEKLTSLVEINLKGIDDIEKRMKVVIPILQNFIEGIKIGLKTNVAS